MSENFIHTALTRAEMICLVGELTKQGYDVVRVSNGGFVCHELGTNLSLILVMSAKRQKTGLYFVRYNIAFFDTGRPLSTMVQ
jgi:hypothetical protein